MNSHAIISLDTNILIVGLQTENTWEARILNHLRRFHVKVARQVEIEL